jgi:ABC-type antimicrobial peptide transport system permease subunit
MKSKCSYRNDELIWEYGGNNYTVIGVFKGENKYGDRNADCYINYTAKSIDTSSFFNFYYEAGAHSREDMKRISEAIKETNLDIFMEHTVLSRSDSSKYAVAASNVNSMTAMLAITALLVFINAVSVCIDWLDGRKKEIRVRKLVGATNKNVTGWLVKNLLLLTVIAMIFGIIFVNLFFIITPHLAVSDSVRMMFGRQINFQGLLIGIVCFIILSLGIEIITLRFYRKSIQAEIPQ